MALLPIDPGAVQGRAVSTAAGGHAAPLPADSAAVDRFSGLLRQADGEEKTLSHSSGEQQPQSSWLPGPATQGLREADPVVADRFSCRELADEIAAVWLARDAGGEISELLLKIDGDLLPDTCIRFRQENNQGLSIRICCGDEAAREWLGQFAAHLTELLEKRLVRTVCVSIEDGLLLPGNVENPADARDGDRVSHTTGNRENRWP